MRRGAKLAPENRRDAAPHHTSAAPGKSTNDSLQETVGQQKWDGQADADNPRIKLSLSTCEEQKHARAGAAKSASQSMSMDGTKYLLVSVVDNLPAPF